MKTDRIDMRVLVEGVLFPHVSAVTVNCGAGEVATATITVPPAPNIQFESFTRARIHIFWSDVDIRSRVAEDQWPLLFEGEISGDSFAKSPVSRHLVWRCSGYHSYWQQVLLSYYDPSARDTNQVVNADKMTMFLGNQKLELDVGVSGASLTQRLTSRFAEDSSRGYLSTVGSVFREALQTNYFFSLADSALKLSPRFLAPKDERVSKLVNREHLLSMISRDITAVSGNQSMMDTLKSILSVMRYQLLVNPQPRVVPKATEQKLSPTAQPLTGDRANVKTSYTDAGVKDDVAKEMAEKTSGSTSAVEVKAMVNEALIRSQLTKTDDERLTLENDIAGHVLKMKDKETATGHGAEAEKEAYVEVTPVLGQFLTVPDTRFAAVPRCNVIFPRDQTAMSLDRDLMAEPTRMFLQASLSANPNKVYIVPQGIENATAPSESVAPAVNAEGYSSPILGLYTVTSGFGQRVHPVTKQIKNHKGIDLAAAEGTPIHAVAAGKVVLSQLSDTAGEFVRIDHGDGAVTVYMHMVRGSRTVKKGDSVVAGQVIGAMGKTGRVTGTHLHFDWIVRGEYRDPLPLLVKTSESQSVVRGRAQLRGRQSPLPADVVSQPVVEAEQVTAADSARSGTGPFEHWKFLTPEEKVRGIVPIFDNDTAAAHKSFELSNPDGFDAYMQNIAQSEFLWRRYLTRSMPSIDMPFNPRPVAGFPGLVVDNHRSIIGLIHGVSHTIAVGGGGGNATTSVSFAAPRFWDEGDPYFWKNGVASDDNRGFPVYYLDGMVPTNSGDGYEQTEPWPEGKNIYGDENRDVDNLYRLLIGCPAIPYEYGEVVSAATGVTVAVNQAVDGSIESDARSPRTVVGHYQRLSSSNGHDAETFVRQFTARETVTERELLVTILQSTQDSVALTGYTGSAFRAEIQALVKVFTQALGNRIGHRG